MSTGRTLELLREEYVERNLMPRAYVTQTKCLGPCQEGNIAFLYAGGRGMWFRRMNTEEAVRGLLAYVDQVTRERRYVPPPPPLAAHVFRRTSGDLPALPGGLAPAQK
ncbi:MAG: (2Fe-2S) ferredoxin domain-containing protein [Planctomycetes bacterium]|nr:(2Fe-2S) ferredoxin domain-containing protein [Planctomycetota bacterium]